MRARGSVEQESLIGAEGRRATRIGELLVEKVQEGEGEGRLPFELQVQVGERVLSPQQAQVLVIQDHVVRLSSPSAEPAEVVALEVGLLGVPVTGVPGRRRNVGLGPGLGGETDQAGKKGQGKGEME